MADLEQEIDMTKRTRADSPSKVCTAEGCEKPLRARGLCASHYNKTYHADRSRACDAEKKRITDMRWTKRRRALERGATAEDVDRHLVGERDGWLCGICQVPVDKELRWPDRMCASLDHVVPLSRGGAHTYANTRITHFICNVKRGAREDAPTPISPAA